MKRHQTASEPKAIGPRKVGRRGPRVADQGRSALTEGLHTQTACRESRFVPKGMRARTHTLILTGELDAYSAHTLEAAMERLCEEGVTGITLDLRRLAYIDPIGVAVIAFRCGLQRRRGCDFALIGGPRRIQLAFERAGLGELLPFRAPDVRETGFAVAATADYEEAALQR
jgi:anti-sigma B factor antagonist